MFSTSNVSSSSSYSLSFEFVLDVVDALLLVFEEVVELVDVELEELELEFAVLDDLEVDAGSLIVGSFMIESGLYI